MKRWKPGESCWKSLSAGRPNPLFARAECNLSDLGQSVKEPGFEEMVAKRRDSSYEPGLRSGAWRKMRINQGEEFLIDRYTPSPQNLRCARDRLLGGKPVNRTHGGQDGECRWLKSHLVGH